jgi:hypothetical protein
MTSTDEQRKSTISAKTMKRARHAQRCNADGKLNPNGRCTMVYGRVWLGAGWNVARLSKAAKSKELRKTIANR